MDDKWKNIGHHLGIVVPPNLPELHVSYSEIKAYQEPWCIYSTEVVKSAPFVKYVGNEPLTGFHFLALVEVGEHECAEEHACAREHECANHWLIGDIPAYNLIQGIETLDTGYNTITQYVPPRHLDCKSHVYACLLYHQFQGVKFSTPQNPFCLDNYTRQNDLGQPVAGAYFIVVNCDAQIH